MQARGLKVAAIIPKSDYLKETSTLQIAIHQVSMTRTSTNPLNDLGYLLRLVRLLRQIQPQTIFSYTAKPVIYGSLAGRLARVPARFSMITGLGHVYTTENKKNRVIRRVMNLLYSLGARASHKIFFQNPDDLQAFTSNRILGNHKKVVRTNGSGVNLERFQQHPLPKTEPLFLFVGRLLTEKGIYEFVEAARRVKEKWPTARFVAVGPHDPSLPHAVPLGLMSKWKSEKVVEFVGAVKDVRGWLKESTALVLPSYREGTPRAVLEALATGRPIITTDAPGCRETVEDGINGLLVAPGNAQSLAAAIEEFLTTPENTEQMAYESRRIAEEKYDVRKVNNVILEAMNL
jgi:glycosyltransferase involved in cell wall biosynthesis